MHLNLAYRWFLPPGSRLHADEPDARIDPAVKWFDERLRLRRELRNPALLQRALPIPMKPPRHSDLMAPRIPT